MPLPCNNVRVTPIKVSQLLRYSNLDGGDFLLTVESGSSLLSRRSTINDLKNSFGRLTGSYSGSFTGSFKGKASGSFSGSYWGSILSKNTKASGSFSGSFYGSVLSKNTKASGSFSGSHYGSLVSKNTKASGSFSGSFYGSVLSKNTKATGSFSGTNSKISGSFSGSHYGSLISKNTKASGSFSGSFYGSLLSKNAKASGSFSGSFYGSLLSKNAKASGSFSGSHYGKIIGSNGSLITGSFRGIDNITNFKGTGKKVSFNGTASYAVSSSYASTGGFTNGLGGLDSSLYKTSTSLSTLNNYFGQSYNVAHGFTSVPSLVRATLICTSVTVTNGYSINDEISVEQLYDDTGRADDERPITTVWTDNVNVGVSFSSWQNVYLQTKSGGLAATDPTSWKVKLRVWK